MCEVSYTLCVCADLWRPITARTLHALVLALLTWSAIWTIVTLPLYPNLTARLLRLRFIFVADLVPVTTLILLRLGYLRQAAYVYMAGNWAQATYNIATYGSIQLTSTAFYITLPILAAWLLGFREALWTAGVCLGGALILALQQGPIPFFNHATDAALAHVGQPRATHTHRRGSITHFTDPAGIQGAFGATCGATHRGVGSSPRPRPSWLPVVPRAHSWRT